ncbi:hypothetical protein [Lysinibacillus sp. 54212]
MLSNIYAGIIHFGRGMRKATYYEVRLYDYSGRIQLQELHNKKRSLNVG